MYLSSYCRAFAFEGSRNTSVLFSTKNAAIAEVPNTLLSRIKKHQTISPADRDVLNNLGLLVADPEKEKERMRRRIADLNRSSRTLSIKLVMNLDCNLACVYCFEGNRKGRHFMSSETADAFVRFVAERIGDDVEEVFLTFYGGEPLLSRRLALYLAKRLSALSKQREVSFRCALQTNGTLLTEATVHGLLPFGLSEVYVTVDGPQENHDAFRPYTSGDGSFDHILKNLAAVCDITDVHLGGNYTKDNFMHFPRLLDNLAERGLAPARIASAAFYPVAAERCDVLPGYRGGCTSVNEPWIPVAVLALREQLLRRGYRTLRVLPTVCMIDQTKNMIVNHNGDLYKCPGFIGRKEFCIGTIRTGISDFRALHDLDNWKNDECLSCAYLPLCFGGCRYLRFVRTGSISGRDCKKPFFDGILVPLVLQDMRHGLVEGARIGRERDERPVS